MRLIFYLFLLTENRFFFIYFLFFFIYITYLGLHMLMIIKEIKNYYFSTKLHTTFHLGFMQNNSESVYVKFIYLLNIFINFYKKKTFNFCFVLVGINRYVIYLVLIFLGRGWGYDVCFTVLIQIFSGKNRLMSYLLFTNRVSCNFKKITVAIMVNFSIRRVLFESRIDLECVDIGRDSRIP